jgi:hypothetical protein
MAEPKRPEPVTSAVHRSQHTLVNLLKINNIRAAAPSWGLHLFWEPFMRKSVSSGLDADGQG